MKIVENKKMPENGDPSRIERTEASLEKLVGVLGVLAGVVERLTDAQTRTDERLKQLETAQAETTDKLNALVQMVDEWIRSDRPANPPTP